MNNELQICLLPFRQPRRRLNYFALSEKILAGLSFRLLFTSHESRATSRKICPQSSVLCLPTLYALQPVAAENFKVVYINCP